MLSLDQINSHSQVSDPGPKGPLVNKMAPELKIGKPKKNNHLLNHWPKFAKTALTICSTKQSGHHEPGLSERSRAFNLHDTSCVFCGFFTFGLGFVLWCGVVLFFSHMSGLIHFKYTTHWSTIILF